MENVNINLVTDETVKEILAGLDDFDAQNAWYEVWAIGYEGEEVTDTEILLGSFEDPDSAVQYAAIIHLSDITKQMQEGILDEVSLDNVDCLSIEVETVVNCEGEEEGTMNVGTIYARTIYINNEEEYRNHVSTTLNHFYEKLFNLTDLINTRTGKDIAVEREKYMKEYINKFINEWNGIE